MPSAAKSTLSGWVSSTRGDSDSMHHDYLAPPFDAPGPDPLAQFDAWFAEAEAAGVPEPEAMTLATAGPHARIVYMRGRFRFFTNYESAKGRQIAADPRVALVFFWEPLHRSVRVEGEAVEAAGGRQRRVLRDPPPRQPARGVGVTAEPGDRDAGGDRRRLRRRGPAAAALGRLRGHGAHDRVLAGPAEPAARPLALPALRRQLAAGAARSLNPARATSRAGGRTRTTARSGPAAAGARCGSPGRRRSRARSAA